jgi:methionyl-tRNA synthetase
MDALRYFMLREMVFGLDGVFSWEALNTRYNADLANNLGNLVSRTFAMVEKYRTGVVPAPSLLDELGQSLKENANQCAGDVFNFIKNLEVHKALERIWNLIDAANVYIDRTKPWALAKDEANAAALDTSLFCQVEVIRIIGILIAPCLPETSEKILYSLDVVKDRSLESAQWSETLVGKKIVKIESLFPRKDSAPSVETPKETKNTKKKMETPNETPAVAALAVAKTESDDLISIDYFSKVKLRVAQIMSAERVEKSEKLLKLSVDVGEGKERQILAGIAKYHTPESIVGRKIGIVANLKPAKLMGMLSEGMVLASSDDTGALALIQIDQSIKIGGEIR